MQIIDFAGVKVDNLNMLEALERVGFYLSENKPHLIVTPNPEMIVACQTDIELKQTLNTADLRVPDGISMVVVSRIKGQPLKERVSGIDLMLEIINAYAKNKKIYLLAGAPGITQEASIVLARKFPWINIVGTHDGYFTTKDENNLIQEIRTLQPDMIFVGLGAGKQEKWLHRHLSELRVPLAMTIGGSLDVISGRKKRAPIWAQKLYIEWLYRLIVEPQRWKRQLALPKFLWLMFIPSR